MVKRNGPARKPKGKRSMATGRAQRPISSGLDTAGMAYAKLIADPCNAPLTHPIYAGGESGYLFRADAVVPFGNTATHTAGFFSFTPGIINSANSELLAGSAVDATTGAVANAFAFTPGKTFLPNASAVRCVAACVRVTFPGAESNRSGLIQYGHASGRAVLQGSSFSATSVGTLGTNMTRTPPDAIEITWKPNFDDQAFVDPNSTRTAGDNVKNSSIVVAWQGLPASTGLTFHITCVWEWQPATGTSIAVPTLSKARSVNSLDNVIDHLINVGFKFVQGPVMSGVTNVALDIAKRYIGNMPAYQRTRNVRQLTY